MDAEDVILGIFGSLILVAGGFLIFTGGSTNTQHYDFAACLADEGATMYGYDACSHCARQKALIGTTAFKQELEEEGYYVKCRPRAEAQRPLGDRAGMISSVVTLDPETTQVEACQANVQVGTPTWVINGTQYGSVQSLDQLAQATGCQVDA
jgi:glutaredoxin